MKTAIITGGTSGIGLATAKIFLAENYNCVLVGRNSDKFDMILKHSIKLVYSIEINIANFN